MDVALRQADLQDARGSAYSITVTSEQAVTLSISFAEVKGILSKVLPLADPSSDATAAQTLHLALKRCPLFSKLAEPGLHSLALAMVPTSYNAGDLVAPLGAAANKIYFLARGALMSTQVGRWVYVLSQGLLGS